jgi:hypothetical protein
MNSRANNEELTIQEDSSKAAKRINEVLKYSHFQDMKKY